MVFPSPLTGMVGYDIKLRTLPSEYFPIHNLSTILAFNFIRRIIYLLTASEKNPQNQEFHMNEERIRDKASFIVTEPAKLSGRLKEVC
jgi:hypothetical protein